MILSFSSTNENVSSNQDFSSYYINYIFFFHPYIEPDVGGANPPHRATSFNRLLF